MAELQHLSPEAHARLAAEFKDLTTRGRIDIADKIERGAELGLAQGGALATLVKVYTGLDPNFNVNEKALADVQAEWSSRTAT